MTGGEFRVIRLKLGLSQRQMARMLGYSESAHLRERVGRIERGLTRLSFSAERLVVAYRDGYRPADWPSEGRAAK